MPPRKRARISAASTPQPVTPRAAALSASEVNEKAPEKTSIAKDPWTDDEETQLLKAIIKHKPTGLHKHFRMISIANDLRSHGYAYGPNSGEHMRIPGIWAKLETLYDLDALDTREDEYSGWAEVTGDEEEDEDVRDFALAEDVFGESMWVRRLVGNRTARNQDGEDVEMKDADTASRESSPELIEGLNSTWCGERERPPHVQALVDKAARVPEEDNTGARGRAKKTAITRAASMRSRATRSTPVQETEEDEDDEDEEEEESTAAGSPAASTKATTKATRKKVPTRKSTRKSIGMPSGKFLGPKNVSKTTQGIKSGRATTATKNSTAAKVSKVTKTSKSTKSKGAPMGSNSTAINKPTMTLRWAAAQQGARIKTPAAPEKSTTARKSTAAARQAPANQHANKKKPAPAQKPISAQRTTTPKISTTTQQPRTTRQSKPDKKRNEQR